ncbi:Magnesium/cobalt efflux protein [Candidatus Defluviicoccus seviourii]|uniref:Magnesium/cobalt efflux protein n=1 Tax=Candidatus Defluviicoccus seviourii TaxID=2565273 RepID=A0A564WAH8_9PROT|nr:Magnesium/cobalt efflux protein [Candidatus Defluviicoccus seviourii]
MNDQAPDAKQDTAHAEDTLALDADERTADERGWLGKAFRRLKRGRRSESHAPLPLSELFDDTQEAPASLREDERVLVHNVLRLRHRSAEDAMVPRADIVAIEAQASLSDVIERMTECGHARLPVYRDTLDDVVGMVHIKDVLAWRSRDNLFQLSKILREVLFVAPSMEVLQLLLEMRVKRSHMALVVDEYGGIDGLLTIEDVVEEIVGEIADEHDREAEPVVTVRADGSLDVDARAEVEVLDEHFGAVLSDDERDDIDTVGGLVVSLAGRVPIRGELLVHPAGLEFEVIDADPRRIKRLRVSRSAAAENDEPLPNGRAAGFP